MVVDTALRNTLQHLQQDPRRWWPMEDFLKAAGYGKDRTWTHRPL
jgi:hypothetical protein